MGGVFPWGGGRHDAGFVPDPYAPSVEVGPDGAGGGSDPGAPDVPGPPRSPATRPYWSPGQRRVAPWSDAKVVAAVGRSVERAIYPHMVGPAPTLADAVRPAGRRLVVAATVMDQRRVAVVIDRVRRDGFPPPMADCAN